MKCVILHGAINTSNFGDVLFASMFYNRLNEMPEKYDVYFAEFPQYGVGSFVRKECNYNKHISLLRQLKSDALVYISGGYLGDNKKSIRLNARRFFRYVLPGLIAVVAKKKIYILGAGGGPLYSAINRWGFKCIMNHSEIITVRDPETKQYFESIGVRKHIEATTDTALAIHDDMLPQLAILNQDDYIMKCDGKKKLFIHLVKLKSVDTEFAKKIIPAVNEFLERNKEYSVIIGSDLELDDMNALETVKSLKHKNYYEYKYHSAWQLCSLLKDMDLIITPKLHVGIIGAALGKSVVSFPEHAYKTSRFYANINEEGRSMRLECVNQDEALRMMEKYAAVPITIDKNVRKLAMENLIPLHSI